MLIIHNKDYFKTLADIYQDFITLGITLSFIILLAN